MPTVKKIFLTMGCVLSIHYTVMAQHHVLGKVLDSMISTGIKDWKIPGFGVVVSKNGNPLFEKAYGVTDQDSQRPVDQNTLFTLASTTKAFTAMALGILVDNNRVKWKDRVIDHLPSFTISDSCAQQEIRVKDLLTHNTGIENMDLLWTHANTGRDSLLHRYRTAKKIHPIRSGFQYNNIMYVIAGKLIEKLSGQPWDIFVRDHILRPLEMNSTLTRAADVTKFSNHLTPYVVGTDGQLEEVPINESDQIGPAGMMWSTMEDIKKYLQFLSQGGIYHGRSILSQRTFNTLFDSHVLIPKESFMYPTVELTQSQWLSYGLGWFQEDYRGIKVNFHTGSIHGLIALAAYIPEKDFALYAFGNLDHAELRHAVLYTAIDIFLFNDHSRSWHKDILALFTRLKEQRQSTGEKTGGNGCVNTSLSQPLHQYAGNFYNKGLGKVTVAIRDGDITLTVNDFVRYTMHPCGPKLIHSDRDNRYREEVSARFLFDQKGAVRSLELFGHTFVKSF